MVVVVLAGASGALRAVNALFFASSMLTGAGAEVAGAEADLAKADEEIKKVEAYLAEQTL